MSFEYSILLCKYLGTILVLLFKKSYMKTCNYMHPQSHSDCIFTLPFTPWLFIQSPLSSQAVTCCCKHSKTLTGCMVGKKYIFTKNDFLNILQFLKTFLLSISENHKWISQLNKLKFFFKPIKIALMFFFTDPNPDEF